MDLESIRIFVKVVQLNGFSRAADLLKLPKSTVSRTITRLEDESGTKLLLRTTRSLTPTAAGRAFYESCLGPVQTLEDARRSLSGGDSMVTGMVRITAPEDIGEHLLSATIAKLTREHRGLAFELNYTDAVVDLVKEGYDLAIRVGKLRASRFKARRLGDLILIPVASPDYLRGRTRLASPQDLISHDTVMFTAAVAQPRWALSSSKGSVTVPVNVNVSANHMTSLINMASEGAGIALVPEFLCRQELKLGSLQRVLPAWHGPTLPVSMVSPLAAGSSARLKIISDRLSVAIQQNLALS